VLSLSLISELFLDVGGVEYETMELLREREGDGIDIGESSFLNLSTFCLVESEVFLVEGLVISKLESDIFLVEGLVIEGDGIETGESSFFVFSTFGLVIS